MTSDFVNPYATRAHVRDVDTMASYDGHDWAPCEWCSGEVETIRAVMLGELVECRDCGRRTVVVDAR